MATENDNDSKGTCFVVMGFGKKTDFETGRVLDLDKSYRNMIKPAVEAAGLTCIRADEIVHSGLIDVPMYEQLLQADVVIADLSTSNKNAFYELGIRHALRPFNTIIVAEDGIKSFPFDVSHIAVRQYHHLGEDIGFEEVMRFRQQLTKSITEIFNKDVRDKDSPVYTFLNNLTPPAIAAAVQEKIQEVKVFAPADNTNTGKEDTASAAVATHSMLMQQVDAAQAKGDWITAKTLLTLVRQMIIGNGPVKEEEDPYILQRLAFITYKSKFPTEKDALIEAHTLLHALSPRITNDSETLGLWGAVHKRLWEVTQDLDLLDESITAYERGYMIRNDHYNGVSYAYLLNARASLATDRAEAIADFIEARRTRFEVLTICHNWLEDNPLPDSAVVPETVLADYLKSRYWVMASMAEAYVGLGDNDHAEKTLDMAYEKVPEPGMKQLTEEQLNKLRPLLRNSPLQYIITEDK